MRKTAYLALGPGRSTKIEMGKRVGLQTADFNAIFIQQRHADKMRHIIFSAAYAKVNAGFAIINRHQNRGTLPQSLQRGSLACLLNSSWARSNSSSRSSRVYLGVSAQTRNVTT